MRLPLTLNIQTGRKLADKTRDEILSEIKKVFIAGHIRAVQVCYDTVRVTFYSSEIFKRAKESPGLYIFGLWWNILGGGPPVTVVNLFDYPFEGEDAVLEDTLSAFGEIKRIKHQSFVSDSEIFTGTRLVSMVLNPGCTLPRFITINGCICRIWYWGQPLICNLCAVQGHKSANCPNKDKCRRCGESGHFARTCPTPWSVRSAAGGGSSSVDPPVRPPEISTAGPSMVPAVGATVDPSVSSDDSLAGLSVGPSVCPSAEASGISGAPGVLSGAATPVESDPEIGVFSSQSQASDPGIGDFSSPPLDASADSPLIVESSSESQSILRNIDISKVGNKSKVGDNANKDVTTVGIENVNSEISSKDVENENLQSKTVVGNDDSVESSMELDASGPSNKRPVDGGGGADDDGGIGEGVGRFLSKIPRFSPRKLISKAQKPSKVAKLGKHSKLPVVLPCRPGRK